MKIKFKWLKRLGKAAKNTIGDGIQIAGAIGGQFGLPKELTGFASSFGSALTKKRDENNLKKAQLAAMRREDVQDRILSSTNNGDEPHQDNRDLDLPPSWVPNFLIPLYLKSEVAVYAIGAGVTILAGWGVTKLFGMSKGSGSGSGKFR